MAEPSTAALLLEIGVEELPSSFVDGALAALPKIVADELAKARLSHGRVEVFGTPRRIATLVRDVSERQLDLDEELVGPPESAAFVSGVPTRAAEAFAAKLGVPVGALSVVEKSGGARQKAGRYVVGRRTETGRPAMDLLGAVLAATCAAIPFPKSMRWGALEVSFGRPVQWLVALFGEEAVGVEFAGIRSSRTSRGHRFLSPEPFEIARPETYLAQLRSRRVYADRDERLRTMIDRLDAAARALGGTRDPEAVLVDENASLVEEPNVVAGAFDRSYLKLPARVIRAAARGHQKYFCVQKGEDELLPHYLAVVNTANRPDLIARGMDRVMRARLADARFFWDEDAKISLAARLEKLDAVVFHHRLGTLRQKVERITRLGERIANAVAIDEAGRACVLRAAQLCKCDLVTLMVGEFPELQGHMGYSYALAGGESAAVAVAIRDHYKPAGAHDDVPDDDVSAVIALADRFDTLAGCFAVGLAPSGAADPFALRRACIGVLRILGDRGYADAEFYELAGQAYDGFSGFNLDLSRIETVARLEEFATERLRGLLAASSSTPVADAVIASSGPAALRNVAAAVARTRVLQSVVDAEQPWLGKAKTVAKRLAGISREAHPRIHSLSSFEGSAKQDDRAIVQLVQSLDRATLGLTSEEAVRGALMSMEHVATELDRIFVETLVNDQQDPFTQRRLETLAYGAKSMLRIADFSKLS